MDQAQENTIVSPLFNNDVYSSLYFLSLNYLKNVVSKGIDPTLSCMERPIVFKMLF